MHLYYHREREGQETCIDFTDKVHEDIASKNVSFATFSTLQNHAEAPAAQGVPATRDDVGLVKYEHTTPSPAPSSPIPPAFLPLVTERLTRTPKPRGRHARKRKPVTKAWSRLSPGEKLEATFDRAFQREAIAFSLNFSGKKIAKLEASADPARDLSCAINRVAKTVLAFPLPIAFSFEFTEDDRLHCHGVAILPDWEVETVKRFRQVLKRAGGMMHGVGSGRQIDVKVLTDWKGWNGYRMKDRDRTVTRLGTSKIDYTSNALKQLAREDHNAELAKRKARRTTHSKPVSVKKPSASLTHALATETRQRASMSHSEQQSLVNQYLLTKYLKNNNNIHFNALPHMLSQAYERALTDNHRTYEMQTASNDIYLPDDLYEEVVNRLAESIPLLGGRDELVARLGEVTGIWPEHTRPDARFEFALAS